MKAHRIRFFATLVVLMALFGAACSDDTESDDPGTDDTGTDDATGSDDTAAEDTAPEDTAPEDTAPEDTAPEDTASDETESAFTGSEPTEIAAPTAEGAGMVLPQPAVPSPDDWVIEEYFIGGTATSFDAVDAPADGHWVAEPADEADYRTRVVVRRPGSAADFSGTVVVEWLNVTAGIEASPDWAFLAEEVGREGHAYISVSAQHQGIEGGDALLEVEADEEAAAESGVSIDTSGLSNVDPERYGTLTHPGDAYSYDIISQVGRAVQATPDQLLGDLEPEQIIAIGESQSAFFLTTYVNAVHPLDPVFDGFLIHSRGGIATPLEGFGPVDADSDEDLQLDEGVTIRTDLDAPVLIFETENDLTILGYRSARQPDTEFVRTWEVAGTAHADAHVIRAITGGVRDPEVGSLLGCAWPINAGPQHEVLQAALSQLVDWTAGGEPPPAASQLEMDGEAIARDENQVALGGVRNPLVDVPVAAYIGDPPDDQSLTGGGVCALFGQTIPFDQATIVGLHGTFDDYLAQFEASAAEAVEAGFLLQPDADSLIEEASGNAALFG